MRLAASGFFRSDHLIAGDGDGLPRPSDTWIRLAALGRETVTIRLGSLMTSATFRHPSLLAAPVAQVDQMSRGQVELGLGAGWWAREHAAIGIELPEIRVRFDRFAQQLEILHGLWSTPVGDTSFRLPGIRGDHSGVSRALVAGRGIASDGGPC